MKRPGPNGNDSGTQELLLAPGTPIAHYHVLEKIGEGGMGNVFLAEDTKLGRQVALKFLHSRRLSDPTARERFIREAKAAAALNHPNIITVYEINEFEEHLYMAMEYVPGQTLAEIISTAGEENKPLPIKDCIDIAVNICEGLAAAHKAGIIHRDIKPHNIILAENNRVKILDFGLARLRGVRPITGGIFRIGTLLYMSPEQAVGDDLDNRADTWALGATLYQLFTGRLPFTQETEAAVFYAILNTPPPAPSELRRDIPPALESIILKCLQKKAENRFSSVDQVITGLQALARSLEEPPPARPTRTTKSTAKFKKQMERRHATVLFARISGHQTLMKKMDLEEAAGVLNLCLEGFAAIIETYGGGINKLMDSSLTALFGVPTAVEEAPKKAVTAAVEMRDFLYKQNRENQLPHHLDIHIGINSGPVIVGAVGEEDKAEFTVMGETVSFAQMMQEIAPRGRIYVGPSVHEYTAETYRYRASGAPHIRGKKMPGTVYKLLSPLEPGEPAPSSRRKIFSELVGREDDLNRLKLHLMEVINGKGAVVSIIGEAGIGKSRLISELKQAEDLKKIRLLEGRSLSHGSQMSYHPIIDMLKNWTGIKEDEPDARVYRKLEQAVTAVNPGGAEDILPFIATLMGMPPREAHAARLKGIEGEALSNLIRKSMRELMIKGAAQRPMVCILHDTHWIDISSLELVEALLPVAAKHRILFIQVLRPNYRETGDRLLETVRQKYPELHTELTLSPLDEADCNLLIRNLIGQQELPENIRAVISGRAEGNPFFIEEVLRSLIDSGMVTMGEGAVKINRDIETAVIPKTIREVLMSRLDRLDEAAVMLLKVASVIGRYFFYKILEEVLDRTGEGGDIHSRLAYLEDMQWIGQRVRLNEVEYHFKHALAQEVTYDSILVKKRKELHLEVAAAIEGVFSHRIHEFYGMLALHYSRGGNLEKAEAYLVKAGREALKSAASNEALSYYKEALRLYLHHYAGAVDPEKVAALKKHIGLALHNKGRFDEAVSYFDDVLAYLGVKKSRWPVLTRLRMLSNLLWVIKFLYFPSQKTKKPPAAIDSEIINIAEKRAAALSDVDVNRFLADSLGVLRRLLKLDASKVENGITILAASSALFSHTGLSFTISRKILEFTEGLIDRRDVKSRLAYNYLRLIHDFHSGNWDNPPAYDEELIDRNLHLGEYFYTTAFPEKSSFLLMEQGDFEKIDGRLAKLRGIYDIYGNHLARGREYLVAVKRLIKIRDLYAALSLVEEAIAFNRKSGIAVFVLIGCGMRAYIRVLLGDIKGAEESLQLARRQVPNTRSVAPNQVSYVVLSRFLLDLSELSGAVRGGDKLNISTWRVRAFRSGKAAVKNARKYVPDQVEVFRLMGDYYWLTGKQKRALVWWGRSIRVGERLGARVELARLYLDVGKRLEGDGARYRRLNGLDAPVYLEKASGLFKELGLKDDPEGLM